MRRSTKKYISSAVGIGAVALGLPVVAAVSASATGDDRCEHGSVEYSLDGGKTWTTNGRMDGALVTKIQVRLKNKIKNSCEYAVSLASYSAEGPTWSKSGKQAFLGWDTTKLSKEKTKATLDVSGHAPKCFGQVDLYGNGKKYDGVDNPLPHYPDAPFPKNLITAWNGGEKCEQPPTTPPTSTPPTSEAPTSKPPTSTPPTSTPPTSTSKPPTSTSPSPTTSAPTTAPTAPGTEPPVGTPDVPPVTDTAPPALADTGGDNNTAVMVGASAGVLLVGGAGVLFWNRRRNNGGTPA